MQIKNWKKAVRNNLLILILSLSMALLACQQPPVEFSRVLYVFGTLVDITLLGGNNKTNEEAIRHIDQVFQQMHRDWHAWKPGGELGILNRAIRQGEMIHVSDSLLPLLTQSKQLSIASKGLFNPAIGELISLWGFHSDELPAGPPPTESEVVTVLAYHPSMSDVEITGDQVVGRNPHIQLDFGGFAKGYALNVAIKELRQQGINNAIVNAGGDLCVSGQKNNRAWKIGIRHPQGKGVLASVDAFDGECVLTSGNYERYREYDGKRYPHILDPRTGMPVMHIASATVISRDGGLADAAATALTVAGVDDWYQVAKQMGLEYVMVVDAQGTVYMNPAMQARIHFEKEPPEHMIITPAL